MNVIFGVNPVSVRERVLEEFYSRLDETFDDLSDSQQQALYEQLEGFMSDWRARRWAESWGLTESEDSETLYDVSSSKVIDDE